MTGRATHLLSRLVGAARILVVIAFAALTFSSRVAAESLNTPAEMVPVKVTATFSQEWDEAEGHVSILRGQCRIVQGSTLLQAQQMVVWRITQSGGRGKRDRLTVYLEDDVRIEEPGSTHNESPTLVTLNTRAGVTITVSNGAISQPAREDALFLRAQEHRRRSTAIIIRTTQVTEPAQELPEMRSVQLQRPPSRIRRIRIRSRSGNDFNMYSRPTTEPDAARTSDDSHRRRDGAHRGARSTSRRQAGGDHRAVGRSNGHLVARRTGRRRDREDGTVQSEDEPFDVYLEGNVVIFQGDPTNPQLMRKVRI